MSYRIAQDEILTGTSITSNQIGDEIDVRSLYGFAVTLHWESTTASADIIIEGSTDDPKESDANTRWVTLSTNTISNDNGTVMVIQSDVYFQQMRARLAYTSGTVDVLELTYSGKGI
jgi:hypothetical protein